MKPELAAKHHTHLTGIIGKRLVFVTNNSTKSRAMYKEKFDKMGIKAEVVIIQIRVVSKADLSLT